MDCNQTLNNQFSTTLPTKEATTQENKPLSRKEYYTDNTESPNDYETQNPSTTQRSPLEENLQLQNINYLKQIKILQDKLSYFENDYFTRTANLNSQIKQFTTNESNLKQMLQEKEIENNYLKQQLNEMEESVMFFKQEVKELYKLHNSSNTRYGDNINGNNSAKINELVNLLRDYSEEISKLKNDNIALKQTLTNYIHNPPDQKQCVQCNCHSNSFIQNDNNSNNNKMLLDISTYLNNEFLILVQWIDTYIGSNYDKNFEVPSLFPEPNDNTPLNTNNNIYSYFNIDSLKTSLENARNKINKELNVQEAHINELKDLLSQNEMKNSHFKSELSELRNKIQKLTSNEYNTSNILEKNSRVIQTQNEKINQLEKELQTTKNDFNSFLETLYQTISNELNTVLHDVNYKTFHDNIISVELDITNSLNGKKLKYDVRNLEYLVTSVFDKLIQFLGELKFDYLNSKEQNMKFLTENISRNANLSDNMASMNAEVSKMQRKVNEQDEIINRLESENNLLKCQIELIEQKSH